MDILANNNIESFVAIITLIIGVAYPIILESTSSIGNKYNSLSIIKLFDNEFFQKKYTIPYTIWNEKWKIGRFEIILYTSCLSIVPLFIDDSHFFSKWLAFIMTIILVISFFLWLEKIILYNNEVRLFNYLKEKHNISQRDEEKTFILKCIEEFAIAFINKGNKNFELEFHRLLYELSILYRNDYLDKNTNEFFVYPEQYYQTLRSITEIYVKIIDDQTPSIGYTVIRGELLLPNDFKKIKISEITYNWLWRHIILISKNTSFVKSFWAHSHQYFWTELKSIQPNIQWNENGEFIELNKDEREDRERERNRFLEFHYAMGGFLLYNKNYETLKYMFTFSQQQPPKYELLPYTMTEIFEWFNWFHNETNHIGDFIGWSKYSFPKIHDLGNRGTILFSICKYLCLLFIRQFYIQNTSLYYCNTTHQPNLPNEILKLYDWQRSLEYFIKCLNSILQDKELLHKLNLEDTYKEKFNNINSFLFNLKENIEIKIKRQKQSTPLSNDKIKQFYISSSKILGDGFKQYQKINNQNFKETDKDLSIYFFGKKMLSNKSFFVDNDIPCLNYDSALAGNIVRNNLERYIPNSFLSARTKGYILNKEDLIKALDKIINKQISIKIIAFNLEWECLEILNKSKYKEAVLKLPSTDLRNFIFILNEEDFPKFTFRKVNKKERKKYSLKKINNKYNIYSSIIDINLAKDKELKEELIDYLNEKEDLNILEVLYFLTEIRFKTNREIIQLKINSIFERQKTISELNSIQSLKK